MLKSLETPPPEMAATRPFRLEVAPAANRRGGWYARCRVVPEFVVVLGMFILTVPIMMLAGLAVRLTSRGPALYRQTRLGRDGRHFTIYKLRSMYINCETKSGPRWCVPGDDRITPVGRIIRRTHIDELPQLWNILRGDMSLIGPRPERPEFLSRLQQAMPRYIERLRVRPGISGLAQVQLPPDSDLADVHRKLAYDLYYIGAMSLWLDLRILMCTPLKICGAPYSVLRAIFVMPDEATVQGVLERRKKPRRPLQPAVEMVPEMHVQLAQA